MAMATGGSSDRRQIVRRMGSLNEQMATLAAIFRRPAHSRVARPASMHTMCPWSNTDCWVGAGRAMRWEQTLTSLQRSSCSRAVAETNTRSARPALPPLAGLAWASLEEEMDGVLVGKRVIGAQS